MLMSFLKIRYLIGLLVPLPILFLGSGCVSKIVSYPTDWAPVDAKEDCRNVAGTYHHDGEVAPGSQMGFTRLTSFTTEDPIEYSGPNITFSFPHPDVFMVKAGAERRLRFSKGEVACNDGYIELKRSFATRGGFGPAWFHRTVTLAKAEDGRLVAQIDQVQLAFLGYIPTYSFHTDIYRFEAISEERAAR